MVPHSLSEEEWKIKGILYSEVDGSNCRCMINTFLAFNYILYLWCVCSRFIAEKSTVVDPLKEITRLSWDVIRPCCEPNEFILFPLLLYLSF